MKKIIPILLIIAGIGLAFLGYNKMEKNTSSLKIGDLEISAKEKDESNTSYLLMGTGALLLIGGLISVGRN